MTKVTIRDAGPAHHPKTVSRDAMVEDASGRKIGIKKLKPSERMNVMLLVGSEASQNEVYFGHAVLAAAVTSIDGDPVFPPTARSEIDVLVDRLDDEGLEAVGAGYAKHFMASVASDEVRDALKN
jgi:hypothetical protein